MNNLMRWTEDLLRNQVLAKLLAVIGGLATLASLVQFIAPHVIDDISGSTWRWTAPAVALVAAIAWAWPTREVCFANSLNGGWTITIGRGDLFEESVPVVVTVDRLATTSPDAVGYECLVAGLVHSWFEGDTERLERALVSPGPRDIRHPPGHTIPFSDGQRAGWLYCLAEPPAAEPSTSWTDVAEGFARLWQSLRRDNVVRVAVPVLGSGFARAQLSYPGLLAMMVLSFHAESVRGRVVSNLRIRIREADFEPHLLADAAHLLKALGYSRYRPRRSTAFGRPPASTSRAQASAGNSR